MLQKILVLTAALLHVSSCLSYLAPQSRTRNFVPNLSLLSPLFPAFHPNVIDLEKELVKEIRLSSSRGTSIAREVENKITRIIDELEDIQKLKNGATSDLIDGKWRLIYSSNSRTASPIQRSFFEVDRFSIFQDISLYSPDGPATVSNIVDFGKNIGFLKVEALASTSHRPIQNFIPRKGDGRIFGLDIFGVSKTDEESVAKFSDSRIDFKFDNAYFKFSAVPFKIPYPVPFRLLDDEVKGWIDITYLSKSNEKGSIRISRGNKGTTFVLIRE